MHVNGWTNDDLMLDIVFPNIVDQFEAWEGKIGVLN